MSDELASAPRREGDRPSRGHVQSDLSTSRRFARTVRTLAVAWLALIVLLLATIGGAYLNLGSGNLWLGLGIAAVKAAIVLWLFMKIGDTKGMVKIAAFAGLFILALLAGLSSTDYRTRIPDPATWTSPLQIAPFIQKGR